MKISDFIGLLEKRTQEEGMAWRIRQQGTGRPISSADGSQNPIVWLALLEGHAAHFGGPRGVIDAGIALGLSEEDASDLALAVAGFMNNRVAPILRDLETACGLSGADVFGAAPVAQVSPPTGGKLEVYQDLVGRAREYGHAIVLIVMDTTGADPRILVEDRTPRMSLSSAPVLLSAQAALAAIVKQCLESTPLSADEIRPAPSKPDSF